jgi:hypothetical protein
LWSRQNCIGPTYASVIKCPAVLLQGVEVLPIISLIHDSAIKLHRCLLNEQSRDFVSEIEASMLATWQIL